MPSALAIGTASRGYLKMLHLHWLLTHPRLHLPAFPSGVAETFVYEGTSKL